MANNETSEIEKIKASIMEYVDGVIEFDFQKGMNPWHPDGLKISFDPEKKELVNETILQTKPNLSQDEIEKIKSKMSQEGNIESIDRTGNAANVKLVWLSERDGNTHEYTDYILLLNIENEWKIVAKVFDIRKVD